MTFYRPTNNRQPLLTPMQMEQQAMDLEAATAAVKSHMRRSKKGKAYKVKTHQRTMKFKSFVKKHGTPRRAKIYKKEYSAVMQQFAKGKLRHGSTKGPIVKDQKVALAIGHSMAKKKAYSSLMKKLKIKIQGAGIPLSQAGLQLMAESLLGCDESLQNQIVEQFISSVTMPTESQS